MNVKTVAALTASGGMLILGLFIILEIVSAPAEIKDFKRTPLTPGTVEWSRWLKRTATWSVYLFNTTNPSQVALGAKPKLEEFGPYVYQVTETKTRAEYDESEETISYTISTAIRFMPGQSIGSEEDEFTMPNLPLIEVAHKAQQETSEEKLFLTWTVAEMMQKGKESRVYRTSNGVRFDLGILEGGTFYRRNETSEVKTGNAESLDEIGKLTRSEGMSGSLFRPGDCDELKGTDGAIFPPDISKNKNYFVYVPRLSRSLSFQYVKATTTVGGIRSFRFELSQEQFQYPGKSNENLCYCEGNERRGYPSYDPKDEIKCPYDGTIAFSPLASMLNVISLPHFLHGAPKLHAMADGMHPDPKRHTSYYELEPHSGLIVSSHIRLQLNLDLLDSSRQNIDQVANISATAYPLLWFDRHLTDLHDDSVADTVFGSTKWLLCAMGIVMVLGSALWVLYVRYQEMVKEGQRNVVLSPLRFSAAEFRD